MIELIHTYLPFIDKKTINIALFISVILFILYLFNYILKDKVRRYAKFYLYSRRKHPLYRLLFNKYDYILKPIRLSINLFFYSLLVDVFIQHPYIDKVLSISYSFLLLWFIYEVIRFFLYAILVRKIHKEKNARRELLNLFLNITKIIMTLVVLLVILAHIGINILALVTSLGIGGAILALSAKDSLTNFFDSLRLISSDAFRQGDWIQTKDVEGFVTEVGLITTKIRTFSNAFVTIPNSKLANDYIKNWSKRVVGRKIKFNIKLKISNNKDELDKVIHQILKMLNNHPDIVNDEKIAQLIKLNHTYEDGLFNIADKYGVRKTMLVYLDKIDVYSMDILVYVFSVSVAWKDWLQTKQDVLKEIIDIIDKSDLEFAYPKEEISIQHLKS
jgi:MscS family membrane protein